MFHPLIQRKANQGQFGFFCFLYAICPYFIKIHKQENQRKCSLCLYQATFSPLFNFELHTLDKIDCPCTEKRDKLQKSGTSI